MAITRSLDVGIDLDGVLYPFDQVIRCWVHHHTGRPLSALPWPTTWALWDEWDMTYDEFSSVFADGVLAGVVFREGAPYADGLATLNSLAGQGHRIHVITARTVRGAEAASAEATHVWLDRWQVPLHSVTITDDKAAVHVDVLLEDSCAQYDAVDSAGGHPVLLERAWNTDHPGRRVSDWAAFEEYVQILAA